LLLSLLVVSNVMTNRVVPEALYVPWNLGVAGAVFLIARRLDGRSLGDLGLSRTTLLSGLRIGGIAIGLTIAVYTLAAAIPASRELFDDARVEDLGLGQVLWRAFVRVPLGTVVLEELAFRGVLPAMLAARMSLPAAVTGSAGLFGLWHVLPSTELGHRNPIAEDLLGDAGVIAPVALAVTATALAGVVLWLLRRWSGSLAAPALAHWSTNGLGYLLAYHLG
jgi:membrane protease YdiL (CAAX protease family)